MTSTQKCSTNLFPARLVRESYVCFCQFFHHSHPLSLTDGRVSSSLCLFNEMNEGDRKMKLKVMFKKYLKASKLQHGPLGAPPPAPPEVVQAKNIEDEENEVFEAVEGGARPALSNPHKKNRKLKWKYGVDPSEKKIDTDVEEFEFVKNSRPALSRLRKGKLKWKESEKEEQSDISSSSDRQGSDSDDKTQRVPKKSSNRKSDKEQEEKEPASDSAHSPRNVVVDVEPLKDRLMEMKNENNTLRETVKRLRSRINRRDKTILVLQTKLALQKKMAERTKETNSANSVTEDGGEYESPEENKAPVEAPVDAPTVKKEAEPVATPKPSALPAPPAPRAPPPPPTPPALIEPPQPPAPPAHDEAKDEDKIDDVTMATAVRVLEVLKRNQLLERPLNYKETVLMANFFRGGCPKTPENTIVLLLDKSIGAALDILANRPHEIDDAIDNQMRLFIMERTKAKTVMLEVMLSRTEFVPISWGGRGTMEVLTVNKPAEQAAAPVEPSVTSPKTPPALSPMLTDAPSKLAKNSSTNATKDEKSKLEKTAAVSTPAKKADSAAVGKASEPVLSEAPSKLTKNRIADPDEGENSKLQKQLAQPSATKLADQAAVTNATPLIVAEAPSKLAKNRVVNSDEGEKAKLDKGAPAKAQPSAPRLTEQVAATNANLVIVAEAPSKLAKNHVVHSNEGEKFKTDKNTPVAAKPEPKKSTPAVAAAPLPRTPVGPSAPLLHKPVEATSANPAIVPEAPSKLAKNSGGNSKEGEKSKLERENPVAAAIKSFTKNFVPGKKTAKK